MAKTVILLCLVALSVGCRRKSTFQENFVVVKDDDVEMKQAFVKARARLPEFWTALATPGSASGFAVKVPFTEGGKTEFFWLTNLERRRGVIVGTVDNNPEIVHNVKMGERVEKPESDVVDWMYLQGRKMYGNFTIRPLFKTMRPEELTQLKAMLAEP